MGCLFTVPLVCGKCFHGRSFPWEIVFGQYNVWRTKIIVPWNRPRWSEPEPRQAKKALYFPFIGNNARELLDIFMRQNRYPILLILCALLAGQVSAREPVPPPDTTRYPNIKASIDDGFFTLAEQQARGVLRAEPKDDEQREALLLLSHALWGQKRYSEMLSELMGQPDEPGFVYWRARAHYELKQYNPALEVLANAQVPDESPFAPSTLRLKGHMELQAGQLENAEQTYKRFVDRYPNHSERVANLFDLADIYARQDRVAEAIAAYEALTQEVNRNDAERAQLKLGKLYYTQGGQERYDEARRLLMQLAAGEDTRLAYRIDAYVELASLEEQAGQNRAAMNALREAIKLSPDARLRVPLKQALARLLLASGDTTTALKLLEECRVEAPDAETAAQLQLQKAGALLQAERFSESADAYQVYLDVADDPAGMAKAYLGKALALWELERYAESAAAFDKAEAVLKDPDEKADALFKAGDAYYQAGNLDESEKRYRKFVGDYPVHEDIPNVLYQLGLTLAKIGRRTEALSTFEVLERSHGSSAYAEKAALRAADVMLAGAQWEDALAKYTLIGETYTNSTVAALSSHQRGLVLYQLGRYADAQSVFEAVVSRYPESEYAPQAIYMRGFCLYLQGHADEAVETCKAFIKDYPKSKWTPEVIFWLAEQYFNQGLYAEAEPLFLRIIEEFKGHRLVPRALYWAGRAAAVQSNYVKAIERYSEVAKNYPDSDVLPQTRFAQGDALTELGEFARGILAFEEVIKNYPESYLVNAAWGRKGDCQFSLGSDNPARFTEAMNSYQAILDRPAAPIALKLQAEYKIGRCLEKNNVPDKAFSRFMNVVYTFINENVEHSTDTVLWFTRSAFGAATIKERERAWIEAVKIYERVVEAGVPASEEATKRIEKIKNDNWLLFEQAEEMSNVGIDG
jgi:TolA-binding protein